MYTCTGTPARAPYAASADPALPAEGMAIDDTPNSSALDTAADSPRALNEPVGLTPSSLINSRLQPTRAPSLGAGSRGVSPSPKVTMKRGSRTGISSRHRHIPRGRRETLSFVSVRPATFKSYRAYSTFLHCGHRVWICSASQFSPQCVHSRYERALPGT